MTREQRRIAIGGSVTLVALLVAIGIVLARGRDGSAEPIPVAEDAIGVVTAEADEAHGSEPLRLRGTDPVSGERVSLADYAGKPLVLNFWASWCGPCKDELPALLAFAEAHPEVAVVGVNVQDDRDGARALRREVGFTWPSIADPEGAIASRLGLFGMPTTFFLDREHVVRASVTGPTDRAGFEKGLEIAGDGR